MTKEAARKASLKAELMRKISVVEAKRITSIAQVTFVQGVEILGRPDITLRSVAIAGETAFASLNQRGLALSPVLPHCTPLMYLLYNFLNPLHPSLTIHLIISCPFSNSAVCCSVRVLKAFRTGDFRPLGALGLKMRLNRVSPIVNPASFSYPCLTIE